MTPAALTAAIAALKGHDARAAVEASQPSAAVTNAGIEAALEYERVNHFGIMANHVEEIATVAIRAALSQGGKP